jgi:hypothetical protein
MPEWGVKSGVRVALTAAAVKGKPQAGVADGMPSRSVLKMRAIHTGPLWTQVHGRAWLASMLAITIEHSWNSIRTP